MCRLDACGVCVCVCVDSTHVVCVCVCVCVCHLCTRPGNARLSQHAAFLSAFRFNPSWIEANAEGTVPAGLIVRTQNCTVGYPPNGCGLLGPDGKHTCCECNMRSANASLQERSILTFTAVGAGGDGSAVGHPKFAALTKDSVVFEPIDKPPLNDDFRGKSRASSPSSVRRPIRTPSDMHCSFQPNHVRTMHHAMPPLRHRYRRSACSLR